MSWAYIQSAIQDSSIKSFYQYISSNFLRAHTLNARDYVTATGFLLLNIDSIVDLKKILVMYIKKKN